MGGSLRFWCVILNSRTGFIKFEWISPEKKWHRYHASSCPACCEGGVCIAIRIWKPKFSLPKASSISTPKQLNPFYPSLPNSIRLHRLPRLMVMQKTCHLERGPNYGDAGLHDQTSVATELGCGHRETSSTVSIVNLVRSPSFIFVISIFQSFYQCLVHCYTYPGIIKLTLACSRMYRQKLLHSQYH